MTIAVSGEITLIGIWGEGNGLYIQIDQPLKSFNSFLYRSIKNMKDFAGGQNQWLDCRLFELGDYEAVLDLLMSLRNPLGTQTKAGAMEATTVAAKTKAVNRHVS